MQLLTSLASIALAVAASDAQERAQTAPPMAPDPAFLKPAPTRRFHVDYVGKIAEVPAGTKLLRVWIPVPRSSSVQTISELTFEPQPKRRATEPRYGNEMAYYEIENAKGPIELRVGYDVERREVLTDLDKLARAQAPAARAIDAAYTKPDRLGVIDAEIERRAAEVTGPHTTTLAKSRAIYDHVLQHMTYDKSGEGWGRGDTKYACEVGKGNCTDFHALFISMARASGIPAGFEIGLYVPYEVSKDAAAEKLGGYHCWAWFDAGGGRWVPVDISEADRFAERASYFFGNHTSNRVTLSAGRDLVLEPPQAGEPLNYFLAPHAEADGKPVAATKDWKYAER